MTDTDHLKLMMLAVRAEQNNVGTRFIFRVADDDDEVEMFYNTQDFGIENYGRYNFFDFGQFDTAREVLELLERVSK